MCYPKLFSGPFATDQTLFSMTEFTLIQNPLDDFSTWAQGFTSPGSMTSSTFIIIILIVLISEIVIDCFRLIQVISPKSPLLPLLCPDWQKDAVQFYHHGISSLSCPLSQSLYISSLSTPHPCYLLIGFRIGSTWK